MDFIFLSLDQHRDHHWNQCSVNLNLFSLLIPVNTTRVTFQHPLIMWIGNASPFHLQNQQSNLPGVRKACKILLNASKMVILNLRLRITYTDSCDLSPYMLVDLSSYYRPRSDWDNVLGSVRLSVHLCVCTHVLWDASQWFWSRVIPPIHWNTPL